MATLIIIAVVGVGVAAFFLLKHKAETAPIVLSPLPESTANFPRIFQNWTGIFPWWEDAPIAKHDLWWHIPENYGVFATGRTVMTAPNMSGTYDPSTLQAGMDRKNRIKAMNPNMKFFVQIGYTEGADATTDFPPDHPWWLRVNGARVSGEGEAHLFNLDLPEVRQHCANCCGVAMETGIWDGIMLDVFKDDANHVDILHRVRAKIGNAPIIVNVNYRICPNITPLVNGIFMECRAITGQAQWKQVQDALDYNERHVIQPAMNCLQIDGFRVDIEQMRAITCLMLTRGNGYSLMTDPITAVDGSTHEWYTFYTKSLGQPVGQPQAAGSLGTRREFEHGTAVFNPPGGSTILLTFPDSRVSMGTGVRSTEHQLPAHDGGIYVK